MLRKQAGREGTEKPDWSGSKDTMFHNSEFIVFFVLFCCCVRATMLTKKTRIPIEAKTVSAVLLQSLQLTLNQQLCPC